MKTGKFNQPWKLAGIYFLIYLLITTILSGVYSLFVVNILNPLHVGSIEDIKLIFKLLQILLPLVIILVGSYIGATIVKRKIGSSNVDKVSKLASIFYIFLELIFLTRDFLVTDINGIPITRNYTQTIITSIITVIVFYFLTRRFLKNNIT